MIRRIKIKGRTGRFDVPSFLWTENETLTLKLDVEEKRVGRYVAVVRCGEQRKTVYLNAEMTVELSPEFIQKGEYQPLTVLLELRNAQGTRVLIPSDPEKGGFCIEPLKIERMGENTCAVTWMQKLEGELGALRTRVEKTENKLKEFEDEGVPLLAENE